MSQFYNDSVFWIEVDKIEPNPFQPRREFSQPELQSLADSIRQYGVLQALVVTRKEYQKEDGGLGVKYELIAGERRLRASRLAGLHQVPVLIKQGDDTDLMKLELAIIENIQREDLNVVDRARAFERLTKEFGFKHQAIADKVGKSREYVSNTMRVLMLPPEILEAVAQGKISEGHTRPLLMLNDRPEEQKVVFKEIVFKKFSVREAERIARKIAVDKVRKRDQSVDPELLDIEGKLQEAFGTRVQIERREIGGKILIDFFDNNDLMGLVDMIQHTMAKSPNASLQAFEAGLPKADPDLALKPDEIIDDRSNEEKSEDDLYSVSNFSI